MSDYTYYYTDLLSDDVLGEIPAMRCSYGESLNSEGKAQLTAPLHAEVNGVQLYKMSDLAPGNTGILIMRDGVPVFGGVLWSANAQLSDSTLQLQGLGYLSLFRRRFVRRTLGFSQITGPTIAAALIQYTTEDGGNADYGVDTTGAIAAGIGRDRTYYDYERKEIAGAIVDLANLRGGFDFRFVAQYMDDGLIHKRFTTTYPSTGRPTGIHLAMGTNIEGMSVGVDATSLASRVDASGGGDAESTMIGTYAETSAYPLFEDVISMSDNRSIDNLVDWAARRVARGRAPITGANITCRGDDPPIGSYIPGDIIMVTAQLGWCDLNNAMRITEYNVEVDDTGHDMVAISVVSLNAFDEFGH
ncbi:MAG TPA: hypothetical protein VH593_06315 [Ktedonobacteraceae bacterium]|jgi:hypothetical protein